MPKQIKRSEPSEPQPIGSIWFPVPSTWSKCLQEHEVSCWLQQVSDFGHKVCEKADKSIVVLLKLTPGVDCGHKWANNHGKLRSFQLLLRLKLYVLVALIR